MSGGNVSKLLGVNVLRRQVMHDLQYLSWDCVHCTIVQCTSHHSKKKVEGCVPSQFMVLGNCLQAHAQ